MVATYDWLIGDIYIPKKPYYQVKEVNVLRVYYGSMKPDLNKSIFTFELSKEKEKYYSLKFKLIEYSYYDSISNSIRVDKMPWHRFFSIFTKK